jgi:FKBP-type peptidyl-prolyl cis-trans isomerase
MYSTAQAFKGKPGVYGVAKPAFKGDLIEAIMFMTAGDSMVCLVDADALYKNSKIKKPDFIKTGDKVQYFIKLVSIKPKELVQKEQQAAFMKQMNEQMAKQKAEAAKLVVKDDKTLQAYFTKKKIAPVKTASGLYYTIKEEGSGEKAMAGDTVTMNYTGTLLNGTKFDSNEDTAFHHVSPYTFVLGRGVVIKGWDEGIALLKTGSKATLYIPSGMAYGAQVRPGSAANPKGIPANSILLFDVQLMKSVHPIPPAPAPIEPKKDSVSKPLMQERKIDTLGTSVPKKGN